MNKVWRGENSYAKYDLLPCSIISGAAPGLDEDRVRCLKQDVLATKQWLKGVNGEHRDGWKKWQTRGQVVKIVYRMKLLCARHLFMGPALTAKCCLLSYLESVVCVRHKKFVETPHYRRCVQWYWCSAAQMTQKTTSHKRHQKQLSKRKSKSASAETGFTYFLRRPLCRERWPNALGSDWPIKQVWSILYFI